MMMALKRRDDNCPIQVPIGCRKKLSEDEKVRFSVAPDGWSSSSSGEDDFVEPIKRKRSLQPKKTSGRKYKKKCVSVGSENEGESSKKGQRFAVANPEALEILAKPYAPRNTQLNTQWAMNNLRDWWKWHNSLDTTVEKCPEVVLHAECLADELNTWLPVYVAETRNKEGKRYSPKTIYRLLTGILRHMTTENPRYPNFLDKKNPEFVDFHRSLDYLFRKLREEGVGAESKQTATIIIEEENMLWDKDILNTVTPKGLFRAVFYYNGKNFVLRGGQEHRELQLSQIVRLTKPDQYEYTENASKNRSGGLAQLRVVNKKVPIYANPTAGERCHVYLLDKYLSKLPSAAKEKGWFYWQPLASTPADTKAPWFAASPCGRNSLSKVVCEMFREAGSSEKKTNHSLRAAGVSQLFEAGVDEKIIQSRSGHRSTDALRMYERITPAQQQAVSNILTIGEKKEYRGEVQVVSAQPSPVCPQALSLPRPIPDRNAVPLPANYFQYMAAVHSTASSPTFSGFQCYGCHINIYQGPVNQTTKPHGKENMLSEQEFESFCDF